MDEPIFLTLDEVLEIHQSQIELFGGSTGIRDMGLLQSAQAMPKAMFAGKYLHADLFEMAAAYLFHLTSNHPFLDGNKRIGMVAAIVFLEMNDMDFHADEDELEQIVMDTAQSQVEKTTLADFSAGIVRRIFSEKTGKITQKNRPRIALKLLQINKIGNLRHPRNKLCLAG